MKDLQNMLVINFEEYFSFKNISRSELLRLFFCVILLGLWSAQFVNEIRYVLLGLITCIGLLILWRKIILLLGTFFCITIMYANWKTYSPPLEKSFEGSEKTQQEINGIVVSFLERKEKDVRVFVNISKDEKILLIAPPSINLHYGDHIHAIGQFEKIRNFNGFDYAKYLRQWEVTRIFHSPRNLEVIDSQVGGWWWLRYAENTRNKLSSNINKSIPLPHSDIALGILLGVKKELPKMVQQDFRQSGLQHLLVVSGFNVSVVMICLMLLLRRFGRRIVFVGSVLGILFFVGMTGGDPPVIRAAIMGTFVGLATNLGRFSDVRNVLLFSFVLMGIFSPLILQENISFFLSASATVGIVLGTPVIEKFIRWIPNMGNIRSILSVTLAAQIAVFPVIGFYFGEFPVIGILSNLLAEPLVPMGMFFSFITSVFGFLPENIVHIIGIPAFIILESLLSIAHLLGKIPAIPISKEVSRIGFFVIVIFFLWGFFSRNFSKKYIESSSVLDFSGQTRKNPLT